MPYSWPPSTPHLCLQGICEGSGRQETGHHMRRHERLSQGDRPEESQNQHQECWYALCPVLRIHDILVWIRIRGSMPLTNGSGSCYFLHWPSRCQKKLIFSAYRYYFLKVHLHHFSKIKSQRELQNSRNQGFSYYFCMIIEGPGSITLTNGSGSATLSLCLYEKYLHFQFKANLHFHN